MARNGSGSYTLPPTVNPVVDGSAITITWANTTLDDIATALTDSLDRNGKGGMLAPIRCADGSVAAPSFSFTADTDSGLYRGGANDVRMSVGNQLVARWATSGYEVTGALTASGYVGLPDGLDSAPGLRFVNEPSSGLYRDGAGVLALSVLGSNIIEASSAGASVAGTLAVSSTIASKKITATGTAGVAGGEFANGTSATAAARHTACKLANGDLDLDGVANPDPGVGLKNKLTPASIVKAWAFVQTDGAGGVTLLGGMNIAAVAIGGTQAYVELTLGEPLLDQNYAALFAMPYGASNPFRQYGCYSAPVGPPFYGVRIEGVAITYTPPPTVVTPINFATFGNAFYVVVFGRQ